MTTCLSSFSPLSLWGFIHCNNFTAFYFCMCFDLAPWCVFPTLIFLGSCSSWVRLFELLLDLQFSFPVSFYSFLLFSRQRAFYSTSFYLFVLKKFSLWHIFHILLPRCWSFQVLCYISAQEINSSKAE